MPFCTHWHFPPAARSYGKIRRLCANYGWFRNKLRIRWSRERENYKLELKSRMDYGLTEDSNQVMIRYRITKILG